jgi:hypothetical protein
MSIISLTCDEILFLAMSVFRHTIFDIGPLVVLDIFGVFTIFRRTAIFSRAIFSRGGRYAKWHVASQNSDIGKVRV